MGSRNCIMRKGRGCQGTKTVSAHKRGADVWYPSQRNWSTRRCVRPIPADVASVGEGASSMSTRPPRRRDVRCSHCHPGYLGAHPNSPHPFVTPPARLNPPLTVHVKFCLFFHHLRAPSYTALPRSLFCSLVVLKKGAPFHSATTCPTESFCRRPFYSAPSSKHSPLLVSISCPRFRLSCDHSPYLLSTLTLPSCTFLPQHTLPSSQLPPSPHSAVFSVARIPHQRFLPH